MIPHPPFIRLLRNLAHLTAEWCVFWFFVCVGLAALWVVAVVLRTLGWWPLQ